MSSREFPVGATGPWPGHPSYVGPVVRESVPVVGPIGAVAPTTATSGQTSAAVGTTSGGSRRNKRNRKTKNRKRKVKRSHKNRK